MADADSSLNLGESIGLAIISEKDLADYALHPEEVRILSPRAYRRRRADFTMGRAAAHFAMKQIGLENPGPVLRGPVGEPLWCDGIVGSITHCYPWSAAVVVKYSNQVAIGVDLETMEGMQGTDISRLVCRKAELAWVKHGDFRERLTMIFSAKEAVYKAFYPLCRRYIDFMEVGLAPFPGQCGFQGEFLATLDAGLPKGQRCAVHCRRHGELVFSCVIHHFQRNGAAPNSGSLTHSVSLNRMT
ncbi:MAG TPA: 4'-phosphopantetheinyl transferase superfamily protein [Candidatus Acidoferrum sp.]|nr:4'-phosphopantetheinyl transferase superfamily protein [Candidatus Acidoferrum sp.]